MVLTVLSNTKGITMNLTSRGYSETMSIWLLGTDLNVFWPLEFLESAFLSILELERFLISSFGEPLLFPMIPHIAKCCPVKPAASVLGCDGM